MVLCCCILSLLCCLLLLHDSCLLCLLSQLMLLSHSRLQITNSKLMRCLCHITSQMQSTLMTVRHVRDTSNDRMQAQHAAAKPGAAQRA